MKLNFHGSRNWANKVSFHTRAEINEIIMWLACISQNWVNKFRKLNSNNIIFPQHANFMWPNLTLALERRNNYILCQIDDNFSTIPTDSSPFLYYVLSFCPMTKNNSFNLNNCPHSMSLSHHLFRFQSMECHYILGNAYQDNCE